MIKGYESFWEWETPNFIIRLFHSNQLEKKWCTEKVNKSNCKKIIAIKHNKNIDQYIPIRNIYNNKKVVWWNSEQHEQIKSSITNYNTEQMSRKEKDDAKINKHREFITAGIVDSETSDELLDLLPIVQDWCTEDNCETLPTFNVKEFKRG